MCTACMVNGESFIAARIVYENVTAQKPLELDKFPLTFEIIRT